MKIVDGPDFRKVLRPALMMGEGVMAFIHANEGIGLVATFICDHERGNPRHISLKSEHDQISHEPDVFFESVRDAERFYEIGENDRVGRSQALCFFNALLDLAHRREIFVEFLTVTSTDLMAQALGILEHKIK